MDAKITEAQVIEVRKDEREAYVDRVGVLAYGVDLISKVARWLLYAGQNFVFKNCCDVHNQDLISD